MPKVSVLMTVFNRDKYIEDSINSVINSSFQDWELIILDDNSSDNSFKLAEKMAESDSRIRLYKNESNLGDYPNRNKAASYASGKYLKYLDSDDMIYPFGLEVMVKAMDTFPESIYGINSNKRELLKPFPVEVTPEVVFRQQFLGDGFFFTGPTGSIIRADKFFELGGFSETRYIGDFDTWLKLSQENNVVVFQPGLVWWRQHEEQEYKLGLDPNKYLSMTTEVYKKYINDPKSPLTNEERKLAMYCLKQRHARMTLFHLLKFRFNYASKYYKNSSVTFTDLPKGLLRSKVHYNYHFNI